MPVDDGSVSGRIRSRPSRRNSLHARESNGSPFHDWLPEEDRDLIHDNQTDAQDAAEVRKPKRHHHQAKIEIEALRDGRTDSRIEGVLHQTVLVYRVMPQAAVDQMHRQQVTRVNGGGKRKVRVLSGERSGEGEAGHEDQDEKVPEQQGLITGLQQMKQIAMNFPDLAENDETADEDDELRPQREHERGVLSGRN